MSLFYENFRDFEDAGKAILEYLHNHLGFNLWMITRTEGNDWIVLQAKDSGYGVKAGQVFNWADSYCSKMVLGRVINYLEENHLVPIILL